MECYIFAVFKMVFYSLKYKALKAKEHYLYYNLINFLSPLFPKVSQEAVKELGNAAYDYFCFLLSFDDFLDIAENSDKRQKFLNLLTGLEQCENAIRQLAALYPTPTTFWMSFQDCKQAYFKAVISEKEFSARQSDFSEASFQEIAKGKSAVCLNTVYALAILGDEDSHNEHLLDCINELHIALQYIDDIDDFKKDTIEKQWTYPQFLLKQYFQTQKIDWQSTNLEIKHKYLFLSGVAQSCLEKAVQHYQNAEKIASELGLIDFSLYLNKQISTLKNRCMEIDFLLAKTKIKAQKSQIFLVNNTLANALLKSKNYLLKNIEADNTWTDFMTSAGTGTAWITGYVAMMLAEFEPNLPILQTLSKQIIGTPQRFLSYNEGVLQDSDSTNFILGFLAMMKVRSSDINPLWLAFIQTDSGWATYKDEYALKKRLDLPIEISVSGWLQSHVCVSAVAANVLSLLGNETKYNQTCEYLLARLETNKWESYWWTSPIYATAFSIMALSKTEKYKQYCGSPASYLIQVQNQNGSWHNPHENQSNAFYTALAIKALLVVDAQIYKNQIEKGIAWLITNQTEDGSWHTNRILQIPATDVTDPKTVENWRNSSFGVNCITDDHNRVFTAVTVWNCLEAYKMRRGDNSTKLSETP